MAVEIERKFLVVDDSWQSAVSEQYFIAQGYLSVDAERTIRVRLKGEEGFLTIKGRPKGLVRREFEYQIPVADVQTMLDTMCDRPPIKKRRYEVFFQGHLWEIDVFEGVNAGLILAEVELKRPDEQVSLPPWVGSEVTGDPKYYNARLVEHPFQDWESES